MSFSSTQKVILGRSLDKYTSQKAHFDYLSQCLDLFKCISPS